MNCIDYSIEYNTLLKDILEPISNEIGREFKVYEGFSEKVPESFISSVKNTLPDNTIIIIQNGHPAIIASSMGPNSGICFDSSYESHRALLDGLNHTRTLSSEHNCPPDTTLIKSPSDYVFGCISEGVIYSFPNFSHLEPNTYTKNKYFSTVLAYIVGKGCETIIPSYKYPPYINIDEQNSYLNNQRLENSLNNVSQKWREKYNRAISNIGAHQTGMLTALEEKRVASSLISLYSDTEKFKDQLEHARKNEGVEWVVLRDNYLEFFIKDVVIYYEVEGVDKDIGDILVSVNLKTGKVKFENKTRLVDTFISDASHPHDIGNGTICLGNASQIVIELIDNMEIASLVEVLLNFASSVDYNDDAGKYITEWPDV